MVVTSPLADSDLTIIGPRLLIAWPAGNSGIVSFFAPQNGINGSLGIQLVNSTGSDQTLSGVYEPANSSSLTGNPQVGVRGVVEFNSSAVLQVAILGSIRTIRDFTEGPSLLQPQIQDAVKISSDSAGSVTLSRIWLDNVTETHFSFSSERGTASPTIQNGTIRFDAGRYTFQAAFDYPQLKQLNASSVLNPSSQDLIAQKPDQTMSLSFLSYTEKLLAGAWRFLTYFGRDSMISLLLLQPVLSEGQGGAVEAVIGAVLERINRTDGSVCHEETIGDYATWLNLQDNITSTAPQYDYKMIDSDYYLPIVMENYFLKTETGQHRAAAFFQTQATVNPANAGLSYADLALINAEKIMNTSAPFTAPGGQTKDNLIHLKQGQIVGEWRDSTYGIGGGRIPYDVNTALVPAALHSIAALSSAGFFPSHPAWATLAARYAQVWSDSTLAFFSVTVPAASARALVTSYANTSGSGTTIPSHASSITAPITYHGLALDGYDNQSVVKVMNTDDCFRLFLLAPTNQSQLTSFLDQAASNILSPFPAGLSTPLGLVVANPAFGGDPVYAANWTNSAYHGTVIWSWPLAMMASGLERQLGRCNSTSGAANTNTSTNTNTSASTSTNTSSNTGIPAFCTTPTYAHVRAAYNHLWTLIEANRAHLSQEVWSWTYNATAAADADPDAGNGEGSQGYVFTPLGALPGATESDVVQLWSLTFLAVQRDEGLR